MPAKENYKALRLVEVEGIYDKSLNKIEAEKVLDILVNEIALSSSPPPSVGIATFNIYQRNYLLERIQEVKMESAEMASRLFALESAGLFVKNLENIQGDERDIMIISTTHGKRTDGRFLQLFGPLNQQKGYKLFNVMITRAKKQVIVCSSIPPSFYQRYTQEIAKNGNSGRACLYTYLVYAKAIDTGNEQLRQSVLELLAKNCSERRQQTTLDHTHNPFIDYLAQKLAKHIDPKRIHPGYQKAGFYIDLVIDPPAGTDHLPFAIEIDGSKDHGSSVAYVDDLYRQKQITHMGYQFFRIYSANWWMNEDQELTDLLIKLAMNI